MILALMIIKLFIYPIVIWQVYFIGKFTGFWKGWIYITLGIAMPEFNVAVQICGYFMPNSDYSIFSAAIPLFSVSCLGIGFYYVLKEVRGGGH